MACKICGNPYPITTDNRCSACIGKPEVYKYPTNRTDGTFQDDSPIKEETENRFYEKAFKFQPPKVDQLDKLN